MSRKHLRRSAVDELLADYDPTYLECRVDHSWNIIGIFQQGGEFRRLAICRNCDMDRYQRWTASGATLPTLYRRPDDYKLPGEVTKTDVRRSILGTSTIYQTEGTMRAAKARSANNRKTRLKVVK